MSGQRKSKAATGEAILRLAAEARTEIAIAEREALREALGDVMGTLDRAAGDPREAAVWSRARGLLAEIKNRERTS